MLCIVITVVILNIQAGDLTLLRQINAESLRVPEISGLQGGYIPKNDILIGNYKLACIIINVNPSNKIKEILFEIKDKNETLVKFFPCANFVCKSNKLVLKSTKTLLGDISFEGMFLPVKDGKYMTVSYDTVVLKGELTITKEKKKVFYNKNQQFTFLFGD